MRAQWLWNDGKPSDEILSLTNYFCRSAKLRIRDYFAGVRGNADQPGYQLTQELLAGKHAELREGIV